MAQKIPERCVIMGHAIEGQRVEAKPSPANHCATFFGLPSQSTSEMFAIREQRIWMPMVAATPGEVPVWAHPAGSVKGPTLSPLYRTAPQAALADPALHRLLALLDALRAGRGRKRALAAQFLQAALTAEPKSADARG